MTDDDLARRLQDAFDRRAREAVSEHAVAPPPRFAQRAQRHRARLLAPVAAAAAVLAVGGSVLAIQHSGMGHHTKPVAQPTTTSPATSTSTAGTPVDIKLLNTDGATYGVGMPVVAFLSHRITSGAQLQRATTATVNGKPISGAWYFERSSYKDYPVEAHWRPQTFWPAHAKIHVAIAAKGLSGGQGFVFADALSLDFTTGARTIAVVEDGKHEMVVTTDGKSLGSYPVSLGAAATPTSRGTKVIMQKGASICMSGPGYRECNVKYTQRLTYGGEYLHAAPWNRFNIQHGIDSSNGCTNLMPAAAQRLYHVFEIGDVVEYPDADGPQMQAGSGYGDWNVPWRVWLRGGLIPS